MDATLEAAILNTRAMDPETPAGLLSRFVWLLTKVMNIRGGKQIYEMFHKDFKRTTVPLNAPTMAGWACLEYMESHTKSNQGGWKSATNGAARKNPRVFMSPTATETDKLNNPLHLFDLYTAHCPVRKRATQMFLTPKSARPLVRFSSFNPFAAVYASCTLLSFLHEVLSTIFHCVLHLCLEFSTLTYRTTT